jgi:hypothetical protein
MPETLDPDDEDDEDDEDDDGDRDDGASADALAPASPPTLMQRAATYDALVADGRNAEAGALCDEMIEYLRFDEESCIRAGDVGEATEAERQREAWTARARALR